MDTFTALFVAHGKQYDNGLGDKGKPAVIDLSTNHNKYEKEILFKSSGFNLLVSNMMSLNRTLPDPRPEGYVP